MHVMMGQVAAIVCLHGGQQTARGCGAHLCPRSTRTHSPQPHVLARPDLRHVVVLAQATEIFVQLLHLLLVRLDAFLLQPIL
jgi:hypothetical protein